MGSPRLSRCQHLALCEMMLNGALVQPWNRMMWEEDWTCRVPGKRTLLALRELGLVKGVQHREKGVRYDLTSRGEEAGHKLLKQGELRDSLIRRSIDVDGSYKRLRAKLATLIPFVILPPDTKQ